MNLFWDRELRKLVKGIGITNGANSNTDQPSVVQSDLETVIISLLANSLVTELAAGESIAFAAKAGDLSGDYLFFCQGFTLTGTGDTRVYTGSCYINGTAIATALGALNAVDVTAELTIVTSENANTCSTIFPMRLKKRVIDGDTLPPNIAGGLAVQFITDGNGNNGLRLFNEDGVPLQDIFAPGV